MPDLIITGIPRSGTSLAAAIIDRAPDALCLSEPGHHRELMRAARNSTDFVTRLGEEFSAVRRTILAGGEVLDRRNADGSTVANYFADAEPGHPREPAGDWRAVSRPGLSSDFTLGIKHNALYAAALPEIAQRRLFRVVAIIRDPVAVLTSWRSLNLPVSAGHGALLARNGGPDLQRNGFRGKTDSDDRSILLSFRRMGRRLDCFL